MDVIWMFNGDFQGGRQKLWERHGSGAERFQWSEGARIFRGAMIPVRNFEKTPKPSPRRV